mmetsp:Transcript_32679/g.93764  ORF Transcript_32679/g.93764 Transcript_32679/m.93764 type:complete len:122 (+) Transcript_32679:100-465(+)
MRLSFKLVSGGGPVALELSGRETIAHVKALLEYRLGIPRDEQKLIFAAKPLEDERTILDYGLDRFHRPVYLVRTFAGKRPSPGRGLLPFLPRGQAMESLDEFVDDPYLPAVPAPPRREVCV